MWNRVTNDTLNFSAWKLLVKSSFSSRYLMHVDKFICHLLIMQLINSFGFNWKACAAHLLPRVVKKFSAHDQFISLSDVFGSFHIRIHNRFLTKDWTVIWSWWDQYMRPTGLSPLSYPLSTFFHKRSDKEQLKNIRN